MTKTSKFVDSFWGTEFTSTTGFDTLCKRMKDGRRLCKDFEDYLKQRSRMENEYSKNLQKLLKGISRKDGFGNLGEAWNAMLMQGERILQIHEAASTYLTRLSEDVKKFQEDQKIEEKRVEELVKKQHSNKINLHNKTISLQKTYISKCREKDNAVESYESANKMVTNAKDFEKAKTKVDRCEEAMHQADVSYRNSVEHLESARESWEKQMCSCCEAFQKQDEERLTFLRMELWTAVNIDSKLCVDVDNCCENIRLKLEKCDIEEDISDFVKKSSTGTERPAQIQYENYYKNQNGSSTDRSKGATIGHRPQLPLPTPSKLRPVPQSRPLPNLHTSKNSESPRQADGDYAEIDSVVTSPELSIKTVVKPYRTQTPVEFQVRVGDVVQILRKQGQNMIEVKIEGSKKTGAIPKSCIGLQ